MYLRLTLTRLIPLLFPLLPRVVLAQEADLECDNSDLTTYLLSVIDHLYTNGLTIAEQMIVTAAESDEGYELLATWPTSGDLTFFAPTDAAFQAAGLTPPFSNTPNTTVRDILAFHTLSGKWGFDTLPTTGKGVGSSLMGVKSHMASAVNSTAMAPLVMQRGDSGAVNVRMTSGNATTWGWTIDTAGSACANIVVIPIDTVLPFPPKLSEMLTMPTTSRSTKGLPQLVKALTAAGGPQQLEALTQGGFTLFAPVDDAWNADIQSAMTGSLATQVLGNHYATNYSLFSPAWASTPFTLPVVSGGALVITQADNGTTVTLGDITATVLRSDIVIENGVVHLIDKVLVDPKSLASTAASSEATSAAPQSSSIQPSGSDDAAVAVQTVPSGASGRFEVYGAAYIAGLMVAMSLLSTL